MGKLLVIEAFYGGSHKQLIDTILQNFHHLEYDLFSLPAKKWHWRARTSALYFSQNIPHDQDYTVLFTSSVLNLAELLGVRADLHKCRKIVYFHENQLVYPVQEIKERDCQYGLNQIMTCLAADEVLFNSNFNMTSFVNNINSFLNIQSDFKPRNLKEKILAKSTVLYFPIQFTQIPQRVCSGTDDHKGKILHLVWPHRWEHDKNPQLLTNVLLELNKRQVDFKVSILGQHSHATPDCFTGLKAELGVKLVNFGFLASKDEYYKCLLAADVVISTAGHEFYGVSMLEATFCGCVPIAPNKLVYPEIYPPDNLYNTSNQLIKIIYNWCRNRNLFERERERFFQDFNFDNYSAQLLVPQFMAKLKPKTPQGELV